MEHRAIAFNRETIEAALSAVPLGGLRVFQTVTSTNDEALAWASEGAPDLALVVADEQTAGRGRSGHSWSTPAGSALALSFVVRGEASWGPSISRLTGLGAVAVADACDRLGLQATIKWPNDVLLLDRKVAGVLVEALWSGNALEAAVIGIGVNVLGPSAPPAESVRFPATSVEACSGQPLDRIEFMRLIAAGISDWRGRLQSTDFLQSWDDRLAFRGQDVILTRDDREAIRGTLDGLEGDGSLRLITAHGIKVFPMGELHLATDDTMPERQRSHVRRSARTRQEG